MEKLYPEINPYKTHQLNISTLHTLYIEECGNEKGIAVVFLHGGPGGGLITNYRRYFDPDLYRIVLFDQRGCGRSTPFADVSENTTWDLVADIEKIKDYLEIKVWAVFGGSWGSTLALAYAQKYPQSVTALFLRGIFLLRKKELDWFYQEGASKIYPDAWEDYIKIIPQQDRQHIMSTYYKYLMGDDPKKSLEAAKAWSGWEGRTSKLIPSQGMAEDYEQDEFAMAFAKIECHYFMNGGFFDEKSAILNNVAKIEHIPTIIVQGRYDVVCPMESAFELSKLLPQAKFEVLDDAGHSLSEFSITEALIRATDQFAALGHFSQDESL